MTKVKLWECDRCEREFREHRNGPGYEVTIEYRGEELNMLQLCEDCNSSLLSWLENTKEFDALADKLIPEDV